MVACSGPEKQVFNTSGIVLTREWTVGAIDSRDSVTFGNLVDLASDNRGGVYVVDAITNQVIHLSSRGERLTATGNTGGGPGELRSPIAARAVAHGNFIVIDAGRQRYVELDSLGNLVKEYKRQTSTTIVPWWGDIASTRTVFEPLIASKRGSTIFRVLRSKLGISGVDTFYLGSVPADHFESQVGATSLSGGIPFAATLLIAVDAANQVACLAHSTSYELVCLRLPDDTIFRTFGPIRARRVTRHDRNAGLKNLDGFRSRGGAIDVSAIPKYKPVVSSISINSSGYVWIRPIVQPEQGTVFHVFSPAGEFRGIAIAPVRMNPIGAILITDGALYGIVSDSLDVESVVKLSIRSLH